MMFYGQCNKCGQRWEFGTASTCKCLDFWEGYVPEPVKPATEESSATQAQQALDKKAENARELGLDYEPAQQEPVAWMTKTGSVWKTKADETDTPLYTPPPPQRKPLSEEEIGAILEDVNAYGTRLYTFARAIEAAHGIGEKK
jgi:hypothetical protein